MARPLRTAAVLSLCAILIPTGCDSPISLSEIAPSATVTANGTVITTVKDVVPVDGHFVSGECLNDGEPFATNGALAVTHHLSLSPTLDVKTFQVKLSTVVLPEGLSLVGAQTAEELIGADKVEGTEEVTLPATLDRDVELIIGPDFTTTPDPHEPVDRTSRGVLVLDLAVEIAEDFGTTTKLEDVKLVCPPLDTDDGAIVVTKQDKLSIDTEVTTPCFNDGVEEKVAISGVLGVVHHLKLTPTDGQMYAMDLSTVAWSQGIQLVGLASAAEALAVGAAKLQATEEVTLPLSLTLDDDGELKGVWIDEPGRANAGGVEFRSDLGVEIAEDFGITTTLDNIEILCPPPPVVDN